MPKSLPSGSDQCIKVTPETYSTSTWEFFYILLKEKDESVLRRNIELFRSNLRSHGQHKLLDYFEKHYFTESRLKQWSTCYRDSIYNCSWLADTNMHVESWHNILKSHILKRKHNSRVDTLLAALQQAEILYFWKWQRVKDGYVKHADPGWTHMLGLSEFKVPTPMPSREVVTHDDIVIPQLSSVNVRDVLISKISACHEQINKKIHYGSLTKVGTDILRIILHQIIGISNVINSVTPIFHSTPVASNLVAKPDPIPSNLITTPVPSNLVVKPEVKPEPVPSTSNLITTPIPSNLVTKPEPLPSNLITTPVVSQLSKRRTTPPVINQYKFKKKKARLYRNSMSVKTFRSSENNRRNRIFSFARSSTGGENLSSFNDQLCRPSTISLICTLSITKYKSRSTLGGLSFSPMLGGIVIPIECDGVPSIESLHVRVYRVEPGSAAYKERVTTQMFLKTMTLVDKNRVGHPVLIGAKSCRLQRKEEEKAGDIFRDPKHVPDNNTIDLEKIIQQVESILSIAKKYNKQVRIELVRYKV